jgi:hypothetical protein
MLIIIPASEWANELQPIIRPIPVPSSPDGRLYNPADGNFYERLEDIENH